MTDDDRKILLRKRCEQKFLQTWRGDPTTREAIFSLWWRYFKAGILDLAGLHAFRQSAGYYEWKKKRKNKLLS